MLVNNNNNNNLHNGDNIKRPIFEGSLLRVSFLEAGGAESFRFLLKNLSLRHHVGVTFGDFDVGKIIPRLEMTDMSADEIRHGQHFGRRINANNLFGIGKCLDESAGGKSNATAQVQNLGLFPVVLGVQLFGDLLIQQTESNQQAYEATVSHTIHWREINATFLMSSTTHLLSNIDSVVSDIINQLGRDGCERCMNLFSSNSNIIMRDVTMTAPTRIESTTY